jgi:acetyl esterase/lipase
MKSLACLLALFAAALPVRAQWPAPEIPGGVTVHRDLAYVTDGHERQKLDLYVPAGDGPAPLIVWVHGGAWLAGSKADWVPAAYLADGYAVASVGYRLSRHAVFPAQIEDVKAAVRWLRAHAADYRLDPDRIAAWGASAGAHLVALLGTAGDAFDVGEHLDRSSGVQAVVDWFGPTDFLAMDDQRLPDGMLHGAADSPESLLIGGAIAEHPDLAARANPITWVDGDEPPFLIVHGDRDPLVPHAQSELLLAALREADVPVRMYTVEGGGHGGFNDPKVDELTRAFLAEHLGMSSEEARVLAVEDAWIQAEIDRDRETLERVLDDRFVVNSSDGTTIDKGTTIGMVMGITMTGQDVTERTVLVDGDHALVFGTSETRMLDASGEEHASRLRYTAAYVKRDGEWKALALRMGTRD